MKIGTSLFLLGIMMFGCAASESRSRVPCINCLRLHERDAQPVRWGPSHHLQMNRPSVQELISQQNRATNRSKSLPYK